MQLTLLPNALDLFVDHFRINVKVFSGIRHRTGRSVAICTFIHRRHNPNFPANVCMMLEDPFDPIMYQSKDSMLDRVMICKPVE